MFDVGFWELTFLMTLALLVLGPDKLPGVVTGVGRWLGRARAMARGLRVQIEREMSERVVEPVARGQSSIDAGESTPSSPPDGESADEPGTRF